MEDQGKKAILEYKRNADSLLRENSYEQAIKGYTKAIIQLWKLIESSETQDFEIEELISEIGIPCHLNISLCYLNMKNYKKVREYCSKVLEIDPKNVKARYRLTLSYFEEGFEKEARESLEELRKDDSPVVQEKVRYFERNYKTEEKPSKIYKSMGKTFKSKDKCTEILKFVPSTVLWLGDKYVEVVFRTPLRITKKTVYTVKYVTIDYPLSVASSVISTLIGFQKSVGNKLIY